MVSNQVKIQRMDFFRFRTRKVNLSYEKRVIVIIISEFLKCHSKAKRTRAPAYSRALRQIKGNVPVEN